VFFFVDALAHGFEAPFLLDLLHERGVDGEVAEGRRVLVTAGCCGASEVVVVRGADEEDVFTIAVIRRRLRDVRRDVRIRPVGALVGPCRSRPGVRVSSVPVCP
jgi:hypothetical protein